MNASRKGYGQKMAAAVLDGLPEYWEVCIVMDWSGGFWQEMKPITSRSTGTSCRGSFLVGHTKRLKGSSENPADIIFGAKAIISGMFRQNQEAPEIDDSYFMPMLKMCIITTIENVREAGLSESNIKVIHDELYQHCLDLYIKGWPANAHRDETDIDEEEEIEDAEESFVSFYEEDED